MEIMPNVHFAKDEIIFEEGNVADAVYLVCSGTVEVTKEHNNRNISLAKLKKDSIFGEMAFISDSPRSATVITLEETWCYSLGKDSFLNKLNETDETIVNVFNDLVDAIEKKNSSTVLIDHGEIEPLDEIELMEHHSNMKQFTPPYSKLHLMGDPKIQEKVNKMDVFMRRLFYNMVNIVYNEKFPR